MIQQASDAIIWEHFVARLSRALSTALLKKISSRKHADYWVLGLRDQLRISLSSAYRVSARRGKTKLDVRFQNGTRQYETLDRACFPDNSSKAKKTDMLLELVKKIEKKD